MEPNPEYYVEQGDIIRITNEAAPNGSGADSIHYNIRIMDLAGVVHDIPGTVDAPASAAYASGQHKDVKSPYTGYIVGLTVQRGGSTYTVPGDTLAEVRLMSPGAAYIKVMLCVGWHAPTSPLQLGMHRGYAPLKVDNEGTTTLNNNTPVTRTLNCPPNSTWLLYGGRLLNGDDVARVIDVIIDNGYQNLHIGHGQSVDGGSGSTYPHTTAGLNEGQGFPFPLIAGDRIRIVFNAGGASSGGIARSSAVVMQKGRGQYA